MKALGFFLIGAPNETEASIKQTVKFAKSLDLEYVQFSKCLAKPLTPLWKQMVEETGQDYWKEWILGNETDHPLPRPWTELSNDEIDRLAKWAYVKFHARFFFLLKSTFEVKSFAEFKRKFLGFMDMLFSQENKSVEDKNFVAYKDNSFQKKP